jgi:hypothetical protein
VVSSATSVIKYVRYNGRILCARVEQLLILCTALHLYRYEDSLF